MRTICVFLLPNINMFEGIMIRVLIKHNLSDLHLVISSNTIIFY